MKMVKSLLLGSAAGLVAVAGAQAADLPVKAKPVQYVKICSLYGEGYYYVPGSDTCIKVGGYVRADYGINLTGGRTPLYGGANGEGDRAVSTYSTRHRANMQMDARTQTQYGTLRSLISMHLQNENGSESFNTSRAYIQWAGFTFGRAVSLSDTWGIGESWHFVQQQNNNDNGANGVNTISYTWELGNGMTLSLGADERKIKALSNLSSNSALKVGAEPSGGTGYAGNRWPTPYVNFKVDQAWGYWSTSFQVHDVRAQSYIGNVAGTGVTCAATQTTPCGAPGDKLGWAISSGAEFKLPMLAPGDRFGFNVRYSQGVSSYGGGTNLTSAGMFGSGNNVAYGMMSDGLFIDGGSIQLTTAWTVGAGYEHNWTPQLKTSFSGEYTKVAYNGTAKSLVNAAVCVGGPAVVGVAAQSAINGVLQANCTPDWGFFQGGVRTLWNPTAGLFLGVDAGYTQVWSAFGGGSATLATPTTAVIGLRPGGFYSFKDQGSVYGVFRAVRVFNSGD